MVCGEDSGRNPSSEVGTLCRSGTPRALLRPQEHVEREDMMRRTRDLSIVIWLLLADWSLVVLATG